MATAAGPAWATRLLAATPSTNAVAMADPTRGLVVVADHQTAGRGRLDRTWETPPGAALTFSAVVDPIVDTEWWPLVPLVAGYAVARTIDARLKWPNDVLVDGRKVCGVLVERVSTRAHGTEVPLAVIGIGINVDQTRDELPVPHATSLALEGRSWDRTELLGELLGALRGYLGLLARSPHAALANYRGWCDTMDHPVRVSLPGEEVLEGTAVDIDDHGALLVRTDEGVRRVTAGDVVHARLVQ